MRPGAARFLRPRAARFRTPSGSALTQTGAVEHAGVAAVDRQVSRAREDRARLQPVEAADRVTEMGRVGVTDVLRQMRQIDVLIGEVQQMPGAFPGAEGAERDPGLLLEQMQEARAG